MRALLVAYNFPPVSSAGVWRTLKLAKFLPEHGVTPSILTVANPSVPNEDESLFKDVDPNMTILRARSLEPGYAMKKTVWQSSSLHPSKPTVSTRAKSMATSAAKSLLFPDPQVLWLPAANAVLARRLLSKEADDVVFISAPPFSQFALGLLPHIRRNTAVVLDYRDEWSTYRDSYEMMGNAGKWFGGPLERALLRGAHVVTTATEAFRQNLLTEFPFLSPERVIAIPNGYDPDDFPNVRPTPPLDQLVITYAGTIFKLTSAAGFLEAVRILHQKEPELTKLLKVQFIGRIVDTERVHFDGMEELGVFRLPYMSKNEVIMELCKSHLVLCILDEVLGNERIYPGKIFELMYLGRPVLTLAPEGALTELVLDHNLGTTLTPRNSEAIAAYLTKSLRAFANGTFPAQSNPQNIEEFHRRKQAGAFKEAFALARTVASS